MPIFKVACIYDAGEIAKQNVRVLMGLFHAADHVDIAIVPSPECREGETDIAGIVSDMPCAFQGRAPYRIVTDPQMADEVLDQADVVLDGASVSDDALFRAYKSAMTEKHLPAYEGDGVVDLYDPEKIRAERIDKRGYYGSTNLNMFRDYLTWLEARLQDAGGTVRVLDMGCGAGAFYYVMGRYFSAAEMERISYRGVDLSRSQIFRARALFPEADFQYGDAASFDCGDEPFDLVILNSVLPFNPEDVQTRILERMARVSGNSVFARVSCMANECGFPVDRQKIAEGISKNTDEPQIEYMLTKEAVDDVIARCGYGNVQIDHVLEFFTQGYGAVTIRKGHPLYAQVYAAMKNAPPSMNRGVGSGFRATCEMGTGVFQERYTVYFLPNDFVRGKGQDRVGADLNVLFDAS